MYSKTPIISTNPWQYNAYLGQVNKHTEAKVHLLHIVASVRIFKCANAEIRRPDCESTAYSRLILDSASVHKYQEI